MIRQVTDNLWGWQATVPDAVDAAQWQEMFEVYVQDREKLDIREKFKAAENLAAYQAMVDRMLTVVEKGYWQPSSETLARLRQTQADLAPAVAAENAAIARRSELQPAPGPVPAPPTASSPSGAKPSLTVRGHVLEEKQSTPSRSAAEAQWSPQNVLVGIIALMLVFIGWWRAGHAGK
jgi:cobaltochelatase CobN